MVIRDKTRGTKKRRRSGKPLQVYFRPKQRERLKRLARDRRIAESELVRAAVDLLIGRLSNGQLELGLGIESE
jgi:hypothetical protein